MKQHSAMALSQSQSEEPARHQLPKWDQKSQIVITGGEEEPRKAVLEEKLALIDCSIEQLLQEEANLANIEEIVKQQIASLETQIGSQQDSH